MSQSDGKCRIMARTQLTITPKSVTITAVIRVVAQRLSVPVWGTGGRRFKSAQPDFFLPFSHCSCNCSAPHNFCPLFVSPFPKDDADLIFPIMRKRKIRRRKICPQDRNLTQSLCSADYPHCRPPYRPASLRVLKSTQIPPSCTKKTAAVSSCQRRICEFKYEKNFSYLRL